MYGEFAISDGGKTAILVTVFISEIFNLESTQ